MPSNAKPNQAKRSEAKLQNEWLQQLSSAAPLAKWTPIPLNFKKKTS
jgi:hypothetical protein